MKTFKVEVAYLDAQPGEETYTLKETYTVEANDAFAAECIAMDKCSREYWTHEVEDAVAVEWCASCHNTGYTGPEGDLCEDCETPITKQGRAA